MTLTNNVICPSAESGFIAHLAGCPQAKLIHILKVPVLSDTWKSPFLVNLRAQQNWIINMKALNSVISGFSPSEGFFSDIKAKVSQGLQDGMRAWHLL